MREFTKKILAAVTGVLTFVAMTPTVLADNPPARVVTPPVPIEGITDDGSYHDLVHPGTAEGGFMQYSLDGVTWFATLPGANTVGVYTVYYRAAGDANHSISEVGTVTARVNRPDGAAFAEWIYWNALGRHADDAVKTDFNASLNAGGNPADFVRTVFASGEFQNRGLSNEAFVDLVYATLGRRTADSAGRNTWLTALANGTSRMSMVEEFINSYEFADTCLLYGLSRGGNDQPNVTVDSASKVRSFVGRLYRLCLGRTPDYSGQSYWSSQLQNHAISGTNCAYGFFFSSEFLNAHYSNTEYVTRLYKVLLGRDPDAQGLANWVDALNRGVSRQDVFYGFAHSAEFTRICSEYGIVRG